jgi:hypothetical protein
MAGVQFAPQESSVGGNIGQSFGTGLGAGLQSLANMKLNEITQQKQQAKASQFWKNVGLEGLGLEYQPESIQKSILDRLEGLNLGGNQMQSQQQQPQMLDQLLDRQEGFSPNELDQTLASNEQPAGGLKIGANPMERRHKETLENQNKLSKDKQEFEREKLDIKQKHAQQTANRSIIKGVTEDFTNYKKIKNISSKMLDILRKNKDKWPEWSGYLPEKLHRDPEVRRYLKYKNQLTSLLAGARKGQPTNFKVKLEQQSGPELSQPFETQETVLQDFVNDADEVFATFKDMGEITKADPYGDLAIELGNRGISRLESKNKPTEETFAQLPDAKLYPNKIATNPATGKKMKSVNGKWKPIAA